MVSAASKTRVLGSIGDELVQANIRNVADNTPVKLNMKLGVLARAVASVRGAPTRQSYEVFDALSARGSEQLSRLTRT